MKSGALGAPLGPILALLGIPQIEPHPTRLDQQGATPLATSHEDTARKAQVAKGPVGTGGAHST